MTADSQQYNVVFISDTKKNKDKSNILLVHESGLLELWNVIVLSGVLYICNKQKLPNNHSTPLHEILHIQSRLSTCTQVGLKERIECGCIPLYYHRHSSQESAVYV